MCIFVEQYRSKNMAARMDESCILSESLESRNQNIENVAHLWWRTHSGKACIAANGDVRVKMNVWVSFAHSQYSSKQEFREDTSVLVL